MTHTGIDLHGIHSSDALLKHLIETYRTCGEIDGVWLFCSQEHPNQGLGMIRMNEGALLAVNKLGGQAFGQSVTKIFALPEQFRCQHRPDGKLAVKSCDECHIKLDGETTQNVGGAFLGTAADR